MTDQGTDLRIQLVPTELITPGGSDTLRDLGGGLVAALVRRRGPSITPVQRDDPAAQSVEDAFELAAAQTLSLELAGLDVRDHEARGVRFRVMAIDGSPFVTAALLWPGVLAGDPGMTDALVCAPRWSSVMVRAVRSRSDIGAASTLGSVARLMIQDTADPCSSHTWWWRRGTFHRIDFDHGGATPVLPAELGPVAAALPD